MIAQTASRPRIVIVGAGYGGIAAARRLASLGQGRYAITLLDQRDHHLLQFALPEVAVGKIAADTLAVPLRDLFQDSDVRICQTRVTGFDLPAKAVQTAGGPIPYDILVIATGSRTATYGIPGVREHAYMLKSLEDALALRAAIKAAFARAAQSDPQAVRRALTFVVVGAGMTGVELAAEMAERLPPMAEATGLSRHLVRIILVERAYHVLPGWEAKMASDALTALQMLGVELVLGSYVMAVRPDGVLLATGEALRADTVIWTGGVETGAEIAASGLPTGERRAILVDESLAVIGHAGVYAIGDAALVRDPRSGQIAPPSAQLAVQQGEAVAHYIHAALTSGHPRPYVPKAAGWLVSVGSRSGVGSLGPLPVRGRIARWLKAGSQVRYLWRLGGLRLVLTHGPGLLAGHRLRGVLPGLKGWQMTDAVGTRPGEML
jgi:NADH dehydrogenase